MKIIDKKEMQKNLKNKKTKQNKKKTERIKEVAQTIVKV